MMSTDRQNRPLFQCSLQSFRGMRIPFRCQLWTGRVCPLLRFISREMVDGLIFFALAMSFFFVPFWSKIKIMYLCTEVNCLYISNAKLINLWETAVSLFVFLALLVEFSSDGGFSPPNPSVFSGIRLFILIYQKIAVLCWTCGQNTKKNTFHPENPQKYRFDFNKDECQYSVWTIFHYC